MKCGAKLLDLADYTFDITENFPSREIHGLAKHIRRTVTSVASNIAEGYDRHGTKEFIQFLGIARASLSEVETQIILAHRRKFISNQELQKFALDAETISKMLWGLRKKLAEKIK